MPTDRYSACINRTPRADCQNRTNSVLNCKTSPRIDSPVKTTRTLLAGLYLLMAVILPFGHLAASASVFSAPNSTCCDHETPPADHDRPHDAGHCALCHLLILPANTSEAAIGLCVVPTLSPVFETIPALHSAAPVPAEQARAPPILTV